MKFSYFEIESVQKFFSVVYMGNSGQQYANTFSKEYMESAGKQSQAPAELHSPLVRR